MLSHSHDTAPSRRGHSARADLLLIAGSVLGIFLTMVFGSMIAAEMPAGNPWLFMASYAVPGGVAFAIYWLISRRV